MKTMREEHVTPYWRNLFKKICHQSSIDEWEGINEDQLFKAAEKGDQSAREYIFWQMKDVIETRYAKDRKRIRIWAKNMNLSDSSEKGSDHSANDSVDNWVSASWMAIFDGYPISDTLTIGPFIKYCSAKNRGMSYLSWIYTIKVGAILYMSNNLDATSGMSIEHTRRVGNSNVDISTSSGNERLGGNGNHSIERDVQDDFRSQNLTPEEEFELKDNLRAFIAFTKDAELNEKKHGFSPMIAFKALVKNSLKGSEAEKNVATLASEYDVARNTFAKYATDAASKLENKYGIGAEDLRKLIINYGTDIERAVREGKIIKIFGKRRLSESYSFELLESFFNDKKSKLKESEDSDRVSALARYLGCEADDIIESSYQDNLYDTPHGSYLILTDEEADKEFYSFEYSLIDDLGLDSFSENYVDYILCNFVDKDWFEDAEKELWEGTFDELSDSEKRDELIDLGLIDEDEEDIDLDSFRESYAESRMSDDSIQFYRDSFGDDSFKDVVKSNNLLDCDEVIEDIKRIDGRGILSSMDGKEVEFENYFIYAN